MTHALEFKWVKFADFKTFSGPHKVKLNEPPGLYFFTGKNRLNPQLGANGCGKSTVFDALFWCFWGKTVKDSRPANAVVPWENSKAAPAVSVKFHRNDVECVLQRTRKPNQILVRQGTESYREIVQEDVPGILGMNEETFRRTILIGQFGTMFLDLKPEAQSAMFNEALGLEQWLKVAKLAGQEAAGQETALAAATASIATLTGRLEETRTQRATAKAMAEEWDRTQVKHVTRSEAAVAARKAALDELDASPVGKPQKAARLRDMLEALQTGLGASVKALRALERSMQAADLKLGERKADRRVAADRLARLEEGKKDKTCPSCGQKVTGKHLTTEIESETELLAGIDKDLEDLKDAADAAKTLVGVGEAEVEKLRSNIEKLGVQISDAERSFIQWQAKRDAAETEWKSAKRELKASNEVENPHTGTVASMLERIQEIKADLTTKEEKKTVAELKFGQFKFWATAFKEIRLSLIDEVLQELEIASTAHAERLGLKGWEIQFKTERETKAGDVSYGFTVLLFPPGQKEPVRWESYSGGEDRRWQLAVTFGLSEVLLARAGLTSNFEVLDEPAQHMSPEGVESLLECLTDRAKEQNKTIFYVDHTSLDRGYFDGVYTVVHDKEGSRVTQ